MSLKELKSLAPWNWDSQAAKHPPGRAALQDFEKIQFAWRHDAKENAGQTPVQEATARERRRSVGISATHEQGSQTPNASGQGRKAASADRARSLLKRKATDLHTPDSRLQTHQQRDPAAQQHITPKNPNRCPPARQPRPAASADTPTGDADVSDIQHPTSAPALSSLTATPSAQEGNSNITPCLAGDGEGRARPAHFPLQLTPAATGPALSAGGPLRPPRWTPAASGRASGGGGGGRGPVIMPSPEMGTAGRVVLGSSAGLQLWGRTPTAAVAPDWPLGEHQAVVQQQLSAGRVARSGVSSAAHTPHPFPSPPPPLFVESTSGVREHSKAGGVDGAKCMAAAVTAAAGEGGGKRGERQRVETGRETRASVATGKDSGRTAPEAVLPTSDAVGAGLHDLPCSQTYAAATAAAAATTPLCDDDVCLAAGGSQHLELTQQPGPPPLRPPLTSPVPLHELVSPPGVKPNEPRCAALAADGRGAIPGLCEPHTMGHSTQAATPARHPLQPSMSQPASQPHTTRQEKSRLQPYKGEHTDSTKTATAMTAAAAPPMLSITGTTSTARPSLLKLSAATHTLQGTVVEGSSAGVPRSRTSPSSSPDASPQVVVHLRGTAAAAPLPYCSQQSLVDRREDNPVLTARVAPAKCSPPPPQRVASAVHAPSTATELTPHLAGGGNGASDIRSTVSGGLAAAVETGTTTTNAATTDDGSAQKAVGEGAAAPASGPHYDATAVQPRSQLHPQPPSSIMSMAALDRGEGSDHELPMTSPAIAIPLVAVAETQRDVQPGPHSSSAAVADNECQRPNKRRCATTDSSLVSQKPPKSLTDTPDAELVTHGSGPDVADGSAGTAGAAASCEGERERPGADVPTLSHTHAPTQHVAPTSPSPPPTVTPTQPSAPSPVAAPSPAPRTQAAAAAAGPSVHASPSPLASVPLSQQQLLVLSQLLAHFRAAGCRHPAAMTAGELVAAIASFCQSAGVPAIPTNIQMLASWLGVLLALERPASGAAGGASAAAAAAPGGVSSSPSQQTKAALGPVPAAPPGTHHTAAPAPLPPAPSSGGEGGGGGGSSQQHPPHHVRDTHPSSATRQGSSCVTPQPHSSSRDPAACVATAAPAPAPPLVVVAQSQPSAEVDVAGGRQQQQADHGQHHIAQPPHQGSAAATGVAGAKQQRRSEGALGAQVMNSVTLLPTSLTSDTAPQAAVAVAEAGPIRQPPPVPIPQHPTKHQQGAFTEPSLQPKHRRVTSLQVSAPGAAAAPAALAIPTAIRSSSVGGGDGEVREGMQSRRVRGCSAVATTTSRLANTREVVAPGVPAAATAVGTLEAPSRPLLATTQSVVTDLHVHTTFPSLSPSAGGGGDAGGAVAPSGRRTPGPFLRGRDSAPPAPFRLILERLSSSPPSQTGPTKSTAAAAVSSGGLEAPTNSLPTNSNEPSLPAPSAHSGPPHRPPVAPLPILPLDTGLPPAPTPLDSLASDWQSALSPAVIALHHMLTHSQQALRSALQAPPPPPASASGAGAVAPTPPPPQLLASQPLPQQHSSPKVKSSQQQQDRSGPLQCASITAGSASAPVQRNPGPDGGPSRPPSAPPPLPPAPSSSPPLPCLQAATEALVSSSCVTASLPGSKTNAGAGQQQQLEPQQPQRPGGLTAGPQTADQRADQRHPAAAASSAVAGSAALERPSSETNGPAVAVVAATDSAAAATMAPPRRPTLTAPGWPTAPPTWQHQQAPQQHSRQGRQQQQQVQQKQPQQHATAPSRALPPPPPPPLPNPQQPPQQQQHPQSSQRFHHPAACMWPPPSMAAACCIPPSGTPSQTQPRPAPTSSNQQMTLAGRKGTPPLLQPQPPPTSSSSGIASAWPLGVAAQSSQQLTASGTNPARPAFPSSTSGPATGPMSSTAANAATLASATSASGAMMRSNLSCPSSHAHMHWTAAQRGHGAPAGTGFMPPAAPHAAYPPEGPLSGPPRQGGFGAGSQIAPKPAPSPGPNPPLQQLQPHPVGEEHPSANALLQPSPSPLMPRGYPSPAGPYGYPAPPATHAHWPYMHPYGWCSSYGTRRSAGSGPAHSLHRPPSDPSMPPVYAPAPYGAYGHMHMGVPAAGGGGGGPAHYGPVAARAGGGGGGGLLRPVVGAGSGGGDVSNPGGQLPSGGAVYGPVRHGRMRVKTGPGARSALPPGFTAVVRGQGAVVDRGMGPPGGGLTGLGWGTG